MKTTIFHKALFLVCISLLCLSTKAQTQSPRLVVRSDDMGAFHSVNMACIEGYTKGVETAVEVMPVGAWFPEAARLLRMNPGLDVGVHLAITSEWENVKWRPLTDCPSLTDRNGYFYPMLAPNKDYPGQSVMENKWKLSEIEQEFRAQIELTLRNIPHVSHLTGHMGCIRFDQSVYEMVGRLAEEYKLSFVESDDLRKLYNAQSVWYDGPSKTPTEKEESFIRMLGKLEAGKNYIFLDHPALDNEEMQSVEHIGYEWVATDRQGVSDLLLSSKVRQAIQEKGIELINYNQLTKSLPRSTPQAEKVNAKQFPEYLEAVNASRQDLHSIMVLRHGKVVYEKWLGDNAPDKIHVLNSVSKTFTASAIGFAVSEGRLKVTDKVISFFPELLPEEISSNLQAMEIRHLLTMSTGNSEKAINAVRKDTTVSWIKAFLATPVFRPPGSEFEYNSMATYMLSAIITKVTGEKLIDYLYPRLFRPLGIVGAKWDESPEGINLGGWGLFVKTEDMAKLGQLFLQKGKWKGEQILPESWIEEATTSHIASLPAGTKREDLKPNATQDSDWLQGYGYQMWRCRHQAYRADGANGQYIIVLPEKDAVIVTTAHIQDMQAELNLIWKYILPAMK